MYLLSKKLSKNKHVMLSANRRISIPQAGMRHICWLTVCGIPKQVIGMTWVIIYCFLQYQPVPVQNVRPVLTSIIISPLNT